MAKLCIPIILGTVRKGRMSEPVAQFVYHSLLQQEDVDTFIIDIRDLPIPTNDAGPDVHIEGLTDAVKRADAYIIVTPEYNHTYPGLLKHVLDFNYSEYLHKAVGVCSVSVGPFGGVRAVEALLPTLKAFGLSTIVTDLNFGDVNNLVNASGQLNEEAQSNYSQRFNRFVNELLWLTRTLKYGREHFSL